MTVAAAAIAGALGALALLDIALAAVSRRRDRQRTKAGSPIGSSMSSWLLRPLSRLAGKAPGDLQARLESAHVPARLDAVTLMGVKLGLAALAGAFAFAVASISGSRAALVLLVGLPAAAFLAPDLLLGRRGQRIRARVLAEVPDVSERLHLAVSSGLPPLRALAVATRSGSGPLGLEMAEAAARAQAGVPFSDSLARVAMRCPSAEVAALVAALVRCQEQGADIGDLLLGISSAARRRESLRIKDRAQKAAPKIQLVVALLLVPAALALIAAALVSGLFGR